MTFDCAPMEGITGAVFRRFHHEFFPGVDRWFTPFLSPTKDHVLSPRDLREVGNTYNAGLHVIPQLMTKSPEDFLWAAGELHAMGYRELNLNLGCPSGTVTAKGKGAGMLTDVEALDRFFDAVFASCPCAISVKTRLGMTDPGEFTAILEVYNRYPLSELIIHPRVRADFYRHPVRRSAFTQALSGCRMPVSFNGGIVTAADYVSTAEAYPALRGIMVGQGLAADPWLAAKVRGTARPDVKTLREFHDRLYEEYAMLFDSRPNAMKRMKELWVYLICSFGESDRHRKRLMKSKSTQEFEAAAAAVFAELPLLDEAVCGW